MAIFLKPLMFSLIIPPEVDRGVYWYHLVFLEANRWYLTIDPGSSSVSDKQSTKFWKTSRVYFPMHIFHWKKGYYPLVQANKYCFCINTTPTEYPSETSGQTSSRILHGHMKVKKITSDIIQIIRPHWVNWNIILLQEIMRRSIILRSCLQGSLRVHPWWLLDGRPHQRPQFQTAKQVPMTSLVTLTQMLVKVRIDYVSQFRSIFCANSMIYWSLSAILLYLQCWCTGDTAVLLLVINMLCKNDDSRGLLRYDILTHMIVIPQWNFIYSTAPLLHGQFSSQNLQSTCHSTPIGVII